MRRILRNPYAHKHLHRLVLPGAPVRERLHERSSARRSARSCARDGHARTKQPRTGHRYNGLASLFKRRADSGSPFGTSLRGPGRHCPPGPRRLRGPVLRFDIAQGRLRLSAMSYRGRDGSRVSGAGSRVPPGALALRIARVCIARGRGPTTSKLAQWVEQRSCKPCVAGSTPVLASLLKTGCV
jgi:hypothetical protein